MEILSKWQLKAIAVVYCNNKLTVLMFLLQMRINKTGTGYSPKILGLFCLRKYGVDTIVMYILLEGYINKLINDL